MLRRATAAFLLSVVLIVSAAAQTSWLEPYRANAGKLIAAAAADQFAWDRLAELTDTYGQRLSGSDNLNRAIAWAVETMKKDGLDNVHTEGIMIPRWVRGNESLEIVNPPHHVIPMLGLGGSIGDGSQYWSWIAIDDITPAILHVLERPEITGPVNFVAPEPVTNEEFTRTLAAVVHRASVLRIPRFAARLAPGNMGDEMLLASQRIVPRRLLDTGFTFRYPSLRPALQALAG